MSGFNSHDFTSASVEIDSYNNKVTTFGTFATGLLFTAYYSAPNTITLQFTSTDPALLTAASSSTGLYTLSGPSAPSVSSITFTPGTRLVTLNLSGPLVSTNTYTLGIADWTVSNGEQANFSGLVVDVILPIDLATVGVGIEQDVILGTPSVVGAGIAQAVGIEQDITLGTPVGSTLVAETGVGISEVINVGTPVTGLFANGIGVGIAQTIALGTPQASIEQEPLGVGFVQSIAVGTPAVDGNPEPFLGVGINQTIAVGTPKAFGGDVRGVGISQTINVGTPVAALLSNKIMIGVGIEQDIALGTPVITTTTPPPPPVDLIVDSVGIEQDIVLGTAGAVIQTFGLILTRDQGELVLLIDPMIRDAFTEGTSDGVDIIAPVTGYTTLTTEFQDDARTPFKSEFAAFIKTLNFLRALPTTDNNDSVPIAKTTSTAGSLTFVDGMLVSKVDPT